MPTRLGSFLCHQLLCFQVVLVREDDWITDNPDGYMSNHLSPMGPLKEIHIVYDELDDEGELVEPKAEDLSVRAQELKDEHADLIGDMHDELERQNVFDTWTVVENITS